MWNSSSAPMVELNNRSARASRSACCASVSALLPVLIACAPARSLRPASAWPIRPESICNTDGRPHHPARKARGSPTPRSQCPAAAGTLGRADVEIGRRARVVVIPVEAAYALLRPHQTLAHDVVGG